LSTEFGITVRYDGDHIIFVGIADNYQNKVEGKTGLNTANNETRKCIDYKLAIMEGHRFKFSFSANLPLQLGILL